MPSNAHECHPTPGRDRARGRGKGNGKGKGRGPGGEWESIVLSTPSREGIDRLINAVCNLAVSIIMIQFCSDTHVDRLEVKEKRRGRWALDILSIRIVIKMKEFGSFGPTARGRGR